MGTAGRLLKLKGDRVPLSDQEWCMQIKEAGSQACHLSHALLPDSSLGWGQRQVGRGRTSMVCAAALPPLPPPVGDGPLVSEPRAAHRDADDADGKQQTVN